mmetsp:Transcript_25140/g.95014  ORF Transcript_25140/g.95014 Transcript_25140/m.95014 type:complete len:211 (+) Transcript_25140:888-1520(+)
MRLGAALFTSGVGEQRTPQNALERLALQKCSWRRSLSGARFLNPSQHACAQSSRVQSMGDAHVKDSGAHASCPVAAATESSPGPSPRSPAPVGPIGPGSSPAPARVRPDALAPALLRRCKARMEPNAVERRALPSTCVGRSRNRHAAIVSGGRTSTPSGSCARVPLPRHSHEVERAPVQTAAASIHGRAAEPAAAVPRSLRAGRAHPPGP